MNTENREFLDARVKLLIEHKDKRIAYLESENKVLERALFKMAEDILRRDLWLSCFDITKGDIAGVVNRYRHDAENVLKRKTRKPLEEETPEQGEEVSE